MNENWQKMPKNGKYLLFFWDKFVITILNSKYMPCLPKATLSNDGNVPGIILCVRKKVKLHDFRRKSSFCANRSQFFGFFWCTNFQQ